MTFSFASSHFALSLVMGAGAAIGVLHLWLWRRGREASSHLWVAAFSVISVLFQLGRYIEVQATEPVSAILGGRIQIGMAPLFVLCLVGFAQSLKGGGWGDRFHRLNFLVAPALCAVGLLTPLMITNTTFVDQDWFGHSHVSPVGGSGLLLIGAYALAGWGTLVSTVSRSPLISAVEKRVVIGSIAAFAVMGIVSLLTAANLLEIPSLIPFGPLVISMGLSYLLVHQHHRMEDELEEMAEERARRLQAADERYQQLVQNAPVGILALDANGCLLAANRHLFAMSGTPTELAESDALVGADVLGQPGLIRSGLAGRLRGTLEFGEEFVSEFESDPAWAPTEHIRVSSTAIRSPAGEVIGVQAIVEDITERRRLENELRQSQKMQAVGGLAAGIAHEINNPMAYVRSNLSMLRSEWESMQGLAHHLPADAREQLGGCVELIDDALEGVDRAVTIVREVNEFSRGQGDGKREADVNELLEDAVRMASPHMSDAIRLERAFGEIPALCCSVVQLRQVLLNLVVNAIHAMPGGGELRLETRHLEEEGEIAIAVEDQGQGIDPELIDRVFDPFFTTKPAGKGTGLGLYICYEIVRMHDGAISVRSEPGSGTCFELRLPLAVPAGA